MSWKQRELEFRAWDTDTTAFLDRWYICHHPNQFLITDIVTQDEFPNAVALQYTGVKDINGKKIFEGDILEILGSFCPNNERHRLVIFKSGMWNFRYWSSLLTYYMDGVFINNSQSTQIIGNYFQNPELMKKYKLEWGETR